MAQLGKSINDLPPELIMLILDCIPVDKPSHYEKSSSPGPAKSMLTWPQISTGVCFGLTCRRHWEIFRYMVPKHVPLFLALSPLGKTPWWDDDEYRGEYSRIGPNSLIYLLESWMKPNYRLPYQYNRDFPNPSHDKGRLQNHTLVSFVSCDTYGKDPYPHTPREAERILKIAAWAQYQTHSLQIPTPFNMGKDWYFAAGQALKAAISREVQLPTNDPRREECNWQRHSSLARHLRYIKWSILSAWVKTAACNIPMHYDWFTFHCGDDISKIDAAEMVDQIMMIPDDKSKLNAFAQDCKALIVEPDQDFEITHQHFLHRETMALVPRAYYNTC
jgi:hypothetical protein